MNKSKQKLPLLYKIDINQPQALRLSAYSVVLFYLSAGLFSWLTNSQGSVGFNPLISMVVYLATLAAHEGVHGFFFWVFGGKPKYGVGLLHYIFPYAYATAPGQSFNLVQMAVIGLSPLFVLCTLAVGFAIAVPALATYASIAFIGNFAGAIGDMWLMRQIFRFRVAESLAIFDERNGLAVYGTGVKAKAVAVKLKQNEKHGGLANMLTYVWLTATAVLILVQAVIPIVIAIMNFKGNIVIGPHWFPFFEYHADNNSSQYTFNLLASLIGGLLFTLLYSLFKPRKRAYSA